jgi:hypothetical protein
VVGYTAKLWEWLTDQERLTWRVWGESRRRNGYNCFVAANVQRVRDRQPPARLPLPDAPPAENPVGELVITNRGGRIRLKLQVLRQPTAPISVWGSRPCNLGLANCKKCPQLGLLPPPKRGFTDITDLYFAKHAGYIDKQRMLLVGKRIFIRTRLELDGWPKMFKPVSAVVPGPVGPGTPAKKG